MTFQDIVPPASRRSIRDIPVPGNRNSKPPTPSPRPTYSPPPPPPSPEWLEPREKRPRFWLWIIAVIALVILFFGVSYFFAKATVKVTPKIQEVDVSQTINANQKSSSLPDGTIPYALITLEKEGMADAPGTGEIAVSQKASGQIIIYNNYSTASQDLIATTRFATPEGLIYRIDKNIIVPGQTTVSGKVTPGSIEATVYADQPGEKYNVGLKDFKVPGFQGTPKADGFYARSKTPLAGGFVGTTKKVSDQDLAVAHAKIEGDLGRDLLQQARTQKPDNFVLFDSALVTRFSALPNGSSTSNGLVSVREKATGYAIVFDRDVLNSYLETSLDQNTSTSTIMGLDSLNFNLLNKANFPSASSTAISFTLGGKIKLVAQIDQQKLKNDLAGLYRSKISTILTNYPSIEKVDVVYRPLWLWSFPKKINSIDIEILNP